MGRHFHRRRETSLSGRSWAIIALLTLIVLLVAAMAWQMQRALEAHNETAIGVLEDYAGLAADEFARRAMAAAGYYGYYTTINELRDAEGSGLSVSPVTNFVFRLQVSTGSLATAGGNSLSPDTYDLVRHLALQHAATPSPQAGLVVNHVLVDGEQHTFVMTWDSPATEVIGFEANREWLGDTLQAAFDENALLPTSLADGALSNTHLYVRMDDSAGNTLFETGTRTADAVVAMLTLADDYNGVFAAHTISVSMSPDLAESLIIGGLPGSQLPLFVAIALLASALLFVAVWQLQRENAVMQLRSNFVAEVSHELRTPLTQIRMFTESLLLQRLTSTEDRTRALSIINREAQRLIHMVENILRFAEEDKRAKLVLQQQVIGPILHSVVDEFKPLADAAGNKVMTTIDDTVETAVDADALRQVLLNLIDNAIKYGPAGQRVSITLDAAHESARITVSDQGPGIPDAQKQRVFDSYYRLDRERDSAIAGAGIGLSVVGDIVHQHGGKLRVEDADGGGARFIVELPL